MNEEEKALLEEIKAQVSTKMDERLKGLASKEELESFQALAENATTKEDLEALTADIEEMSLQLKAMKEKKTQERETIKSLIENHSEVFKTIKSKKGTKIEESVTMEVSKATAVASQIGDRDYLGAIEPGIERKPVRRTSLLDIFGVDTVSSEYLHYWEEDVVTRDAQFVVACAPSVHTTNKTWIKRTIELAKIRDCIDICIDMLEDYDFVESELKMLLRESIQLKKEAELLSGLSANATDMLSIDSVSSEFNVANPLADFTSKFASPTIEQVVDAMSAQIYTFGQQNKWIADTVLMSYIDLVCLRNEKDADGNKLMTIDSSTGDAFIAGLRVVTSPLIAPNTLYVLDSTKGRIKQRKSYTVNMSMENKDNIEHELMTIVAYERVQFHVRNINRDAFMKCSDISAAVTALSK